MVLQRRVGHRIEPAKVRPRQPHLPVQELGRGQELHVALPRRADDEVSLDVAKLHCDLLAICMASGILSAATLQIGDIWEGIVWPR